MCVYILAVSHLLRNPLVCQVRRIFNAVGHCVFVLFWGSGGCCINGNVQHDRPENACVHFFYGCAVPEDAGLNLG